MEKSRILDPGLTSRIRNTGDYDCDTVRYYYKLCFLVRKRTEGGYLGLPGVVLVPIAAPLEQVLHLPVLPEPLVQHLHIQIFVYNSVT
jgi:hypothetical protein